MMHLGLSAGITGGLKSAVALPATDPLWNNVTLLLNMEQSVMTDISKNARPFQLADSPVSATQKRWGSKSLSIAEGHNNAYLASGYEFFASDFCIEFSVFPTSSSGSQAVIYSDTRTVLFRSGAQYRLTITNQAGTIYSINSYGGTWVQDAWTDLCIERVGTALTLYQNGVAVITDTLSGECGTAGYVYLTQPGSATYQYVGFMDAMRITKDAHRYAGAYTPADFPVTGP